MHARSSRCTGSGFRVQGLVRVQGLGRAPEQDLGDAHSLVIVLGQHVAQPCCRLLLLHETKAFVE